MLKNTKTEKLLKRPRVVVYRSNKFISAQVIDDLAQKTLVAVSQKDLETKKKLTKIEQARELGTLLAKKTLAKKVKKVRFDRRNYRYHGRVKALAEALRKGGLDF